MSHSDESVRWAAKANVLYRLWLRHKKPYPNHNCDSPFFEACPASYNLADWLVINGIPVSELDKPKFRYWFSSGQNSGQDFELYEISVDAEPNAFGETVTVEGLEEPVINTPVEVDAGTTINTQGSQEPTQSQNEARMGKEHLPKWAELLFAEVDRLNKTLSSIEEGLKRIEDALPAKQAENNSMFNRIAFNEEGKRAYKDRLIDIQRAVREELQREFHSDPDGLDKAAIPKKRR